MGNSKELLMSEKLNEAFNNVKWVLALRQCLDNHGIVHRDGKRAGALNAQKSTKYAKLIPNSWPCRIC